MNYPKILNPNPSADTIISCINIKKYTELGVTKIRDGNILEKEQKILR